MQMIWGQFFRLLFSLEAEFRPRLGKTIQTLVRIVEGKPHMSDKGSGYIPSTL